MKTFLIIPLILFGITLKAQVFKPGLIAGISGSQIEGDGYGGYNKLGFIAGSFVSTEFSKKISAQLEIYFINKGSFDPAHPEKGDYDQFKVNINYIEIPLVINYDIDIVKFEAGIYLAKVLGTPQLEDEFGPIFVYQYPFKSYDFGWLIGSSYQINERFSFNLRAKSSIIPIRDFENTDQRFGILNKLFNRGWYNLDLNFSLRYHFVK